MNKYLIGKNLNYVSEFDSYNRQVCLENRTRATIKDAFIKRTDDWIDRCVKDLTQPPIAV